MKELCFQWLKGKGKDCRSPCLPMVVRNYLPTSETCRLIKALKWGAFKKIRPRIRGNS